jgi:ribonuclease VapC
VAEVVLDSGAVLAALFGERGAEVALSAAPSSLISSVNYAEALSRMVEEGLRLEDAIDMLARMGGEVVAVDALDAIAVGGMFMSTRRTGTSLADRFFLALVRSSGLPGLTTDRRLAELDMGVEVRLIR